MDTPPPDDDPPTAGWFGPDRTREDGVVLPDDQREHTTAPHPIAGDVAAAIEAARRQGFEEGYNEGLPDGRAIGLRDGRLAGRDEAIGALIRVFRAKYGPADRSYKNVVEWIRHYLGPL